MLNKYLYDLIGFIFAYFFHFSHAFS